MKKYFILIFIITFIISIAMYFYSSYNKSTVNTLNEDNTIKLKIAEIYEDSIIAITPDNAEEKYEITNSKIIITNNKENLTWEDLKQSQIIEVHFSGTIKEVYPAIIKDITKIIILSD